MGLAIAVRRDETMAEFYRTTQYQRRYAKRVSDLFTQFEEAVQTLSDNGAFFGEDNYELGWFFALRCNVAALPDEDYKLEPLKSIMNTLFPELHWSSCGTFSPGRQRGAAYHGGQITGKTCGGKSRDASTAEMDGKDPEGVTSGADDHEDIALHDIHGMVREELEALAADLEDASDDFQPDGAVAVEDAAVRLAQIPEALAVVCEACRQLGRGRSSGCGQGHAGKDKAANRAPSGISCALADKIRAKKAKSACHFGPEGPVGWPPGVPRWGRARHHRPGCRGRRGLSL